MPTLATAGRGEWQITAVGGVEDLTLILLAIAATAMLIWTWRSFDPRLARRYRLAVLGLRLGAFAAAVGLLVQPVSSFREVRPHPSRFAVVVDNSGSMSLGRPHSRLERSRRILDDASFALGELDSQARLAWYSAADELLPAADMDAATRPAEGFGGTNLLGALRALQAGEDDEPLVGVLLISDGADTAIGQAAEPALAVHQALREFGLPVNTLAVTGGGRKLDLSVSPAKLDAFAFSRSETPIPVTVRGVGVPGTGVEVSLWNEGSLMQQKTVDLVGGEGRVTFNIRPGRLGQQVLTISVPVPEGDEVPENNTVHLGLEVVRDKLRVLHVAGQPSWDQRFLRDALDSWPRVDLVSFYVLRTPQQSEAFGTSGLALIPFPTESLFEEHLDEFDVVVFQDFDPGLVGVDRYLDALAEFVRGGGGFALVGGGRGFGSGALARSALGGLLPVRLPDSRGGRLESDQAFRARPTEAGRRHPVLRLVPDRAGNDGLLDSLGRLDGAVRVAGLAPGGIGLLEHPNLSADDGPAPVLAVRESGEGRTLAVTTDSLWRWRFSEPLRGGEVDVYPELWRRALNWLVRDPELDRLRVTASPLEQEPGSPVAIEVELHDESYLPVPGAELAFEIRWLDEAGAEQVETARVRLDGEGHYRREWTPRASGPHRVSVTADDGLAATGRFLVRTGHPELSRLDTDERLLAAIAAATGGRHQTDTLDPLQLARVDAPAREVLSRRDTSLWDHPLALLLLFGLLAAEWLLRRRAGMV